MITKHDLQEAIAECEGVRNPTSNTCMKLAAFYTIKDKLYPEPQEQPRYEPQETYSMSAGPLLYSSESEFGKLVAGLDITQVMPVIDELMSTIRVISPKLYAGVINKISEI